MSERDRFALPDERIARALEEGLDEETRRELEERAAAGDGDAALLLADLEAFGEALRQGANAEERDELEQRKELDKARLRRALRGARAEDRGARVGRRAWTRRIAGIASAAAAVVVVVGLLTVDDTARRGEISLPSGGSYVLQPMEYSAPPLLRGETIGELWGEAGVAYEAERWQEAAATFAEIAERDAASSDARLYQGICLLMLAEYERAETALTEARERAGADAGGSIGWHLALAQLGAGDVATARETLIVVERSGGIFADEAARLLPSTE